jgi:hypothetical protein
MSDSSWFRKYVNIINEAQMYENFSSMEAQIVNEIYSIYVKHLKDYINHMTRPSGQQTRMDEWLELATTKNADGNYELDDDTLADIIADYIHKNPQKVDAIIDQNELERDIGPKPNRMDIDHTGFEQRMHDWEYEKYIHAYHLIHDFFNYNNGFEIFG